MKPSKKIVVTMAMVFVILDCVKFAAEDFLLRHNSFMGMLDVAMLAFWVWWTMDFVNHYDVVERGEDSKG